MPGLISLRRVESRDLPILFGNQLDPEASRMAAFPSRDRDAFLAHWNTTILGNPAATSCVILVDGGVVGHIGAWTDANTRERFLCYWLGREFWGRGIASAATSLFLQSELIRPIKALVAKHNIGSIRVLEKAGFTCVGEDVFTLSNGTRIEEYTYVLQGQIRDQPLVV